MRIWGLIVRRRWILGNVVVLAHSLMCPQTTKAAFEDNGTGSRPTALGNAYTALGDDILSLYYNPATLVRMAQPEVATEYSRLYAGLSDGSKIGQYMLSAGIPTRFGVIGVGWKQLSLSGLYQERTLCLGYGRWFGTRFALGATFKQLHHSFTVPATTVDDNGYVTSGTPSLFAQEGNGKSVYSADVGTLFRLGRYQWIGATLQNVNSPNAALDSADSDRVARTLRLAWAYQDTHKLSVTSEFEYEQAPDGPKDQTITTAAEKGWSVGKAAIAYARGALTGGSRQTRRTSTGFGLKWNDIKFDYAFIFDISGVSIGNTAGTHRLTFSYAFAKNRPANIIKLPVPTATLAPVPPPKPPPAMSPAITEPPTSIMNVPEKDLDILAPMDEGWSSQP